MIVRREQIMYQWIARLPCGCEAGSRSPLCIPQTPRLVFPPGQIQSSTAPRWLHGAGQPDAHRSNWEDGGILHPAISHWHNETPCFAGLLSKQLTMKSCYKQTTQREKEKLTNHNNFKLACKVKLQVTLKGNYLGLISVHVGKRTALSESMFVQFLF